MKRKRLIIIGTVALAVLASAALLYIFKDRFQTTEERKDFSSYISAHTAGVVSVRSSIQVVFPVSYANSDMIGQRADNKLMGIKPSVKGNLYWTDERTLEFQPSERLKPDKEYKVTVALDKLLKQVPKGFNKFKFSFRTIKQSLELRVVGLDLYDDPNIDERRIAGSLVTADYVEPEDAQKLVKATQNGAERTLTWQSNADGTIHNFWVEGIVQSESRGAVAISCNGSPIDVSFKQTIDVDIPPLGEFSVLGYEVIQAPEQSIEVRFSERLDPKQKLQGLVTIANEPTPRFLVEGNLLRVFPSVKMKGTFEVEIHTGIRSHKGKPLLEGVTLSVAFESHKPEVRFLSSGVILPSSGNMLVPFQAVSLRAIDLKVIRIFEQNIGQFLQVNDLSGRSELQRVGRTVLIKTFRLDAVGQTDLSQWNTFNLDLTSLISPEQGAVYQIEISFNKDFSTYECEDGDSQKPLEMKDIRYKSSDDVPQSYYYYDDDDYYYYYDWNERDNPCSPSYFYGKSIKKNVLISDIGIIAKGGTQGSYQFIVTNLASAQPMSGVSVEVLNFQQQVLASGTTDNNGMVSIQFTEQQRPFLAIVRSGQQRGYLKLDESSALSVSAFDVSGASVQNGIKGFLYGERGVWRPGDTLFVSFVLENKEKTLPSNHPVSIEVRNPLNQQIYKTISTSGVRGMYAFPVPTKPDAPTGTYTATVSVGGATFTKYFKVETIMPNRLKINIDFENDILSVGQRNRAKLTSSWLHGAPARNLMVRINASFSQASTSFKGYEGYVFDDPARSFWADDQEVFQGNLNENGQLTFEPNINVGTSAPGMLQANFTARVFEEGGAFSIDRFSMPYHPYRTYVGVKMPNPGTQGNMFYTDTTYTIDLATIQSDGKPQPHQNLKVEVYKIDWRWWWDRSSDDLSNYISSSYYRPIVQGNATTNASGKASFNMRVEYPEWGRFLVRVSNASGGHAAGTIIYMDWPGWVKRDKGANAEAASMLTFSTNKDKYNVGDMAHITIPSSKGAKIFLSVENGSKSMHSKWVDAKGDETVVSIPITAEMAPNVYFSVMLIQPHGQTQNDLPIRLYGIVPVLVEDAKTKLEPQIKMPDELAPEKKATITISEKNGNPMAFTLAVVDDGLLDLTRFATPNPWQHFYAREALGVRTWDLYDLVMGAHAGSMQRIISVGGDGEAVDQGNNSANRFKPVVRYFGPFDLPKGKKKTIEFNMPNYVGSVRTMVIAASEGAYGSASKTTPVKKPLMVLATLPRVLGPEEEVVLPVSVFAMDKKVKSVKVALEPNELLTVEGSKEQTLQFDDIGDKTVRFNLKVAKKLGVARIKVVASSGKETASHEIELNVRNANPPMTLVRDTLIKAQGTWKASYTAFGMEGTNTASMELSVLPPINLGKRLHYLLGYPHGCLEQTVSKAFPQLFLPKLADVSQTVQKSCETNVRYAIDRMKSFRTSTGGLSLWPGGTYTDEWATIYAGHFMLEAQKLGYTIPDIVMDGWKRSQRQMAQRWSPSSEGYVSNDVVQAYRLYALALAKAPEVSAMNRLREMASLSVQARWRLAAAYAVVGNSEAARKLVEKASTSVGSYRELSYTYGSDFRDMAMIVETMTLLGKYEEAMPLLRKLSDKMSTDQWLSTQETAFALVAYSKFAEANPPAEGIEVQMNLQGTSQKSITKQPVLQNAFTPVQSGNGQIEVKNNGKGALFARLVLHGLPLSGMEAEQASGVQIDVAFYRMDGSRLDPSEITQGTDFYADIKTFNPGTRGSLEQLILTFVVPSGWEIRNSRLDGAVYESSDFEYQDIRDDRIYTYFNLGSGASKKFRFMLNAAYQGYFYMPGVACEAMYDNSVNARSTGTWVNVITP